MAQWYLFTLSMKPEDMALIEQSDNAGSAIAEAINIFAFGNNTGFPSDSPYLPESVKKLQRMPEARPIVIDGQTIGMVLGRYYDGNPVGAGGRPAVVPEKSYVFSVIDTEIDSFLGTASGQEIIDAINDFEKDPNDKVLQVDCLTPVFAKKSEGSMEFRIIKKTPFLPGDEALFECDGGGVPYNMPANYKPPRIG